VDQIQDISIRYFKEEDYEDIVRLSRIPVKAAVPDKEFEEDRIGILFREALKNENTTGISLVINGKIQGYVFGCLTPHYFHSSVVAYCLSIFVKEEYRKYGKEMLKAFEAWGRYKKADVLSVSTFTNLSPKNLGKLYKNLGYSEKEVIYWKDI
jgi:hypothetical protein